MFLVFAWMVITGLLSGDINCAVYVPGVLGHFNGGRPNCEVMPA
jgi:hypothetical protein